MVSLSGGTLYKHALAPVLQILCVEVLISRTLVYFPFVFNNTSMGRVDLPPPEVDGADYAPPADNELVITIERDWTVEEERKAKRKYETSVHWFELHASDIHAWPGSTS